MHPYLKVDLKFNTNYYKYFIKNNNKKYKTIKKQKGGIIYTNNNSNNSFDIKYIDSDKYEPARLFIGNKNYGCFLGLIYNNEPNELIIQDFMYNHKCNTTKNLLRISGMKNLMNVIKKYIKENLQHIKIMRLTDKAILECISEIDNKKHNIILSNLYFLKYGRTYYQHKYNFKFDDYNMNIILQSNISLINNYKLNKSKFITYINKFDYNDKLSETIKLFFNNYNILNYKQISSRLNKKYDCLFLELLIDYIFKDCNNLQNLFGKEYFYNLYF